MEAVGAMTEALETVEMDRELVGRNVLPGRWTLQVLEDYENTYYTPFHEHERQVRALSGLETLRLQPFTRRVVAEGTGGRLVLAPPRQRPSGTADVLRFTRSRRRCRSWDRTIHCAARCG